MPPICNLCENLRHVVERDELWTLALNRNQDLPGKAMPVLNRHCGRVADLTEREWASVRPYTERVKSALDNLFAPDLYNFALLMNYDAHVHLRVVPRYASPVEWRGETYTDPHYGSLFGRGHQPASVAALDELAETLKERL